MVDLHFVYGLDVTMVSNVYMLGDQKLPMVGISWACLCVVQFLPQLDSVGSAPSDLRFQSSPTEA